MADLVKDAISQKLQMAGHFAEASLLLFELPAYKVPADEPDLTDEERAKQRQPRALTAYFLDSVILELVIKVNWELDHYDQCRNTHNIASLYGELCADTRNHIKRIYDMNIKVLKDMMVRSAPNISWDFQSLNDALVANASTIRDYKYEGSFEGKSSALGKVIWDGTGDFYWSLPPSITDQGFQQVTEALYEFTKARAEPFLG